MMEFNGRLLKYKEYLIVADLHIGFEKELEEKGYSVPSQTKKMLEMLKDHGKNLGGKKIIVLGDLKHDVPRISPQEKREVPFFVRKLQENFDEVIIIKGNHDGGLEKIIPIDVKKEFVLDEIGFLHGHALPSKEFLEKTRLIVMGHIHPSYRWRDHLGITHSKSCWIIGKWEDKKLIVVPVFNELFAGSQELIGPFSKNMKKEEIILIDMTKVM